MYDQIAADIVRQIGELRAENERLLAALRELRDERWRERDYDSVRFIDAALGQGGAPNAEPSRD